MSVEGEIALKILVWSRDITLKFAYFDFLSKDLSNDIYDLGVLYIFENPAESLQLSFTFPGITVKHIDDHFPI